MISVQPVALRLRQWLLLEPLRDSIWVNEPFQPQLFIPKFLVEAFLFVGFQRKLVENAVVETAQIDCENQNAREIENDENKTKPGHHIPPARPAGCGRA